MAKNVAQEILGVVDVEAERVCIAAMIKDEQRADDIIAWLHKDMFSEPHRQLIFMAVKELRSKNMVVTTSSITTMAAQVASRERFKENRVSARVIEQFMDFDIGGKDVLAHVRRLAYLQPYRGAADDVQEIMRLISRRADEVEIHAELMALLAKLSQQRFAEESNVYLGSEMGSRMRDLLEESKHGVLSPFYWPWKSVEAIAPRLPRGMMMIIGMMDGQGKSAVLEHIMRHNARKGAQCVHVATEYIQKTRDARQLGQIAGISAKKILVDGNYTSEQEAKLERAIRYAESELGTYHFVHAGGKNIDEVLGTLHAMPVIGDIYALDYVNDLAYSRDDRPGDENGRSNNAVRKFHAFLEARNAVGILIVQAQKAAHEIASLEELTRKLLMLGAPAISKSQETIMGYRKINANDGADPDWDENGMMRKPVGRKGQLSRLLGLNVNKSSLGGGGFTYLDFGPAQIIKDIPEQALDAILNRVSTPFGMSEEILSEV